MMTQDEWFNKALKDYENGTLGAGKLLDLGAANPFPGVQGWITARLLMNQSIVKKAIERHDLTINDLMNLPSRLCAPAMICISRTATNAFVVITDLVLDGKPLVAAVHKFETRNVGVFNDIRSLHLRPVPDIKRWIKDGLMVYEDKEKAQVWLQDSAPCN